MTDCKLFLNIFRFDPNPNLTKFSNFLGSWAGIAIFLGVNRTTAESTFGGGTNAAAGTVQINSQSAKYCTRTDNAPKVREPGLAYNLSATSFWTNKTIESKGFGLG